MNRKIVGNSDNDNDDYDHKGDDEQNVSDNPRTSDDEEETQEDEFVHTPKNYVPTDDENVDDEEYERINKEMYDDMNVELKDAKTADEGKGDEEMTDAEKVDVENENINKEVAGDQVNDDAQATVTDALATQKTEVPLQSSSITSDYVTKFLKFDNIPSADTEIISMMDILVQHEDPTIHQRLSDLKMKSRTLRNRLSHSSAIPAAIKSEVPTVVKEYLGTSLDDTLHKIKDAEQAANFKRLNTPSLHRYDWYNKNLNFIRNGNLFKTWTKTKSFNKNTKHKALCHALMESILEDEDAMDKGVVDKLKKRKLDDADRDEGPPAGPDQGLKRKKMGKDTKPPKKAKSTGISKGTTKSQPKSTDKSAQAEETVFKDGDTQVPQDLREDIGNTDEPPVVKAEPKNWFKKPERPPTPDPEWSECKIVDRPAYKLSKELAGVITDRIYMTSLTNKKASKYDLQGIEDMKQVGDLQLCVESYQKNLNISRPLTHKAGIIDLEPYTTYSNPQGVIYLDKIERNRLMCSHELYKFSDGTLISVRDKLKDMLNNLEMGYTSVMLRRRWSNLDKKRSHIMVKDIDHQLLERRLMRSLEKFVGGRVLETQKVSVTSKL
ncbi:hypothetical protein Tco_0281997 [Tanacetum coccineum]